MAECCEGSAGIADLAGSRLNRLNASLFSALWGPFHSQSKTFYRHNHGPSYSIQPVDTTTQAAYFEKIRTSKRKLSFEIDDSYHFLSSFSY